MQTRELRAISDSTTPDSVAASASTLGIPSTYCLSIGTEGLLGDLRVLASIEIKRKVCVPQDICKSNSSAPSQSPVQDATSSSRESACLKCLLAYIIASNNPYMHRMFYCMYVLHYPSPVPLPCPQIPLLPYQHLFFNLLILTCWDMGTLPVVTTQKKMSLPPPTTINYYTSSGRGGACKVLCFQTFL